MIKIVTQKPTLEDFENYFRLLRISLMEGITEAERLELRKAVLSPEGLDEGSDPVDDSDIIQTG